LASLGLLAQGKSAVFNSSNECNLPMARQQLIEQVESTSSRAADGALVPTHDPRFVDRKLNALYEYLG